MNAAILKVNSVFALIVQVNPARQEVNTQNTTATRAILMGNAVRGILKRVAYRAMEVRVQMNVLAPQQAVIIKKQLLGKSLHSNCRSLDHGSIRE